MLGVSRLVQRLSRLCFISFLICSYLGAVAWGQPPATSADPFAGLRSGSLTVWESGRASFLGWHTIQRELSADFPQLQITFRLLAAKDFVTALSLAQAQGSLPDVVFVDNWFQAKPMIEQQSVVEMIGQPRFEPSRGWWFLMQQGAHPAAAATFLHWLEDDPHRRVPFEVRFGQTQQDSGEIFIVAGKAIQANARCSSPELLFDRDAANSSQSPVVNCPSTDSVTKIKLLFLYGYGRIAYASLAYEAKSDKNADGTPARAGYVYCFVVLRKGNDGWQVLLLIPGVSPSQSEILASRFNFLRISTDVDVAPLAPNLLEPYSGDHETRFPKQNIVWQQNANRPAAYIVESQFSNPQDAVKYWSPSAIAFVNPSQYGDVVRMPMPFGQGMQPHRWRVWAVGKDGQIALSEWRTVNFTN
jgi:hypothetical protein